MPPHDENINPKCVKLFTESSKIQATLETILANHLDHDKEDRKDLKETLDEFNLRIKELPTIKVYAKIAAWITGLVLGALIVGYVAHLL